MRVQHAPAYAPVESNASTVADEEMHSLLGAVVDMLAPVPLRIDGIVLLPLVALVDACGVIDGDSHGLHRTLLAPVVGAPLVATDVGRMAAVSFIGGDVRSPLILGLLAQQQAATTTHAGAQPDRVVISAATEIVLRCGNASLTLNESGRVVLRGEHISSHSAGVHAIRGATVQIN